MILSAIFISIVDLMVILMAQVNLLEQTINHQIDDYHQQPYGESKFQANQFKTTCYVIVGMAIIFMGVIWWFTNTYLIASVWNWLWGIISVMSACILAKYGYGWLDKISNPEQ